MAYLDVYTGNWTSVQARHLLRRTTFGPSVQMVTDSMNLGLHGTVDTLFAPISNTGLTVSVVSNFISFPLL